MPSAAISDAIHKDSHYAQAFAGRSQARRAYTNWFMTGPAIREGFDMVEADARKAIALAPDLADDHLALAVFFDDGSVDFARANEEYERALELAPSDAHTLRLYGLFAVCIGRSEVGVAAGRRAVLLDPLNRYAHAQFGWALYEARRYREAITSFQEAVALDPEMPDAGRGLSYYALGDYQSADAVRSKT